jgi:hypothetical protein
MVRARHAAPLDQRPSPRRSELAVRAALAIDRDTRQVAELGVVDAVRAPAPPIRPADASADVAVGKRLRRLATGEDHDLIVRDPGAAAYRPNG